MGSSKSKESSTVDDSPLVFTPDCLLRFRRVLKGRGVREADRMPDMEVLRNVRDHVDGGDLGFRVEHTQMEHVKDFLLKPEEVREEMGEEASTSSTRRAKRKYILLEYPTGTGKTMTVLHASQMGDIPCIWIHGFTNTRYLLDTICRSVSSIQTEMTLTQLNSQYQLMLPFALLCGLGEYYLMKRKRRTADEEEKVDLVLNGFKKEIFRRVKRSPESSPNASPEEEERSPQLEEEEIFVPNPPSDHHPPADEILSRLQGMGGPFGVLAEELSQESFQGILSGPYTNGRRVPAFFSHVCLRLMCAMKGRTTSDVFPFIQTVLGAFVKAVANLGSSGKVCVFLDDCETWAQPQEVGHHDETQVVPKLWREFYLVRNFYHLCQRWGPSLKSCFASTKTEIDRNLKVQSGPQPKIPSGGDFLCSEKFSEYVLDRLIRYQRAYPDLPRRLHGPVLTLKLFCVRLIDLIVSKYSGRRSSHTVFNVKELLEEARVMAQAEYEDRLPQVVTETDVDGYDKLIRVLESPKEHGVELEFCLCRGRFRVREDEVPKWEEVSYQDMWFVADPDSQERRFLEGCVKRYGLWATRVPPGAPLKILYPKGRFTMVSKEELAVASCFAYDVVHALSEPKTAFRRFLTIPESVPKLFVRQMGAELPLVIPAIYIDPPTNADIGRVILRGCVVWGNARDSSLVRVRIAVIEARDGERAQEPDEAYQTALSTTLDWIEEPPVVANSEYPFSGIVFCQSGPMEAVLGDRGRRSVTVRYVEDTEEEMRWCRDIFEPRRHRFDCEVVVRFLPPPEEELTGSSVEKILVRLPMIRALVEDTSLEEGEMEEEEEEGEGRRMAVDVTLEMDVSASEKKPREFQIELQKEFENLLLGLENDPNPRLLPYTFMVFRELKLRAHQFVANVLLCNPSYKYSFAREVLSDLHPIKTKRGSEEARRNFLANSGEYQELGAHFPTTFEEALLNHLGRFRG